MRPSIRNLMTALMIAAVAPLGLAVLDLEQPAHAKNGGGNGGGGGGGGKGGGNGGGHGGGNGGGHGGGNGGGNGGSQDNHGSKSGANANANATANAKGQAKAAKAGTVKAKEIQVEDDQELGLAPDELGKLNGVLHASPNAIANASASSPIGTAREFGATLAGMLGDETPTPEEEQAAMDQLGAMMANMTNKPVTGDQVQAVAGKLGFETTEAPADPTTEQTTASLDQETADAIAAEANEIHGFGTGDETAGDETAGDETAGDETAGDETAGDETAGDETAGDETAGDETADETADTGDTGETGGETVTN